MQEQEAAKPASTRAKGPSSGASSHHPRKGEDMSDRDVAKLIVVKPSRGRAAGGSSRAAEAASQEAHLISDGLRFYERELQEVGPFALLS